MIIIEVFLDNSWHDISKLLEPESFSLQRACLNDDRTSVVSSCSMTLYGDHDLYLAISSSHNPVPVKISDGLEVIFEGEVEPDISGFWQVPDRLTSFTIDCVDFSVKLDEKIMQSASYPAVVDGPAFWIYNPEAKDMSILYRLLEIAGLSTRIDKNAPAVMQRIKHIAWNKGEVTYRDVIDPLLSEYGYCLRADGEKLTWFPTAEVGDFFLKDEIKAEDLVSTFSQTRLYEIENGVEVVWPKTKVMEDALLWRGDLPIGDTANPRPGEPIAAGDYWPEDSDIIETWQDFGTEFLDTDYLSGATRLKNEEMALISSSNQYLEDKRDEAVVIDPIEQSHEIIYEALRARLRYKNTSDSAARLYYSQIKGKALVKTHKITSAYPEGCSNPQSYETSYVYDQDSAERLAKIRYMYLRHGLYKFSFSSKSKFSLGEVYRVEQRPIFDGYIQISSAVYMDNSDIIRYGAYSVASLDDIKVVSSGSQGSGTASPGQDGSSPRFIYKREYVKPEKPVGDNPAGWTFDVIPDGNKPVWMSMAKFASTGNLLGDWSEPVRVSGADNGSYRGTSVTAPSDPVDGDFFIYTGVSNSTFIQYHIYRYVAIDDEWVETLESDNVMACQKDALQLAKETGMLIYAAAIFVELLVARKLMVGGGDLSEGLLMRFMDDDGSGKPIIEIRYNGEKLFWLDLDTGGLYANFRQVVQYLPFSFNDSLDSSHPAVFSFYIPEGTIDWIKLRVKSQPFRTYAKNATAKGELITKTGYFEGISYKASLKTSAWPSTIKTNDAGSHTHSFNYPVVSVTEEGQAKIQKEYFGEGYYDDGHTHNIKSTQTPGTTGSGGIHNHSIDIPQYELEQTGNFEHEHRLDITHSHNLELGIEEDSIASDMTVSVDDGHGYGSSVSISSGEEQELNIRTAGWKELKITSKTLGRVQVQVIVKIRIDTTQK